jgi:hypothetical protein
MPKYEGEKYSVLLGSFTRVFIEVLGEVTKKERVKKMI